MFAAGNLTQLSKPSNRIRLQGRGAREVPWLTDGLQVLHHQAHHGPHARPVALGAQGLRESGGLGGQPRLSPSPSAQLGPSGLGLRLFLPLPPRQASHLCCKVSRT